VTVVIIVCLSVEALSEKCFQISSSWPLSREVPGRSVGVSASIALVYSHSGRHRAPALHTPVSLEFPIRSRSEAERDVHTEKTSRTLFRAARSTASSPTKVSGVRSFNWAWERAASYYIWNSASFCPEFTGNERSSGECSARITRRFAFRRLLMDSGRRVLNMRVRGSSAPVPQNQYHEKARRWAPHPAHSRLFLRLKLRVTGSVT
jgi:hypothetical protein